MKELKLATTISDPNRSAIEVVNYLSANFYNNILLADWTYLILTNGVWTVADDKTTVEV